MRIISWNVNGIRAAEKKWEIQNLVTTHDPDIFFMQEIKGTPDKFSESLNHPEGYMAHYNPAEKAGYAGTWVWIHNRIYEEYDVAFLDSFPWDPTANEWRVAHVALRLKNPSTNTSIHQPTNFHIFGIYFPNGGKSEQAWQDKLVFYREFAKYMDELRASGASVIWGGDINCAHHEIDLARPKENDGKIGFHPSERAWLDGRVGDGWHDIWRTKNPDVRDVYSWWDVITKSRERNVGWRIDALWSDSSTMANIRNIEYLPNQMGSDHCPILLDI